VISGTQQAQSLQKNNITINNGVQTKQIYLNEVQGNENIITNEQGNICINVHLLYRCPPSSVLGGRCHSTYQGGTMGAPF
jgi:hypothetical protein